MAHSVKWTRELVLQQILAASEAGVAPSADDLGTLFSAAQRHGGWQQLCAELGLQTKDDSTHPSRRWTPERVLQELRRLSPGGGRAPSSHRYPYAYQAARRRFGSWEAACAAAGLKIRAPGPPQGVSYKQVLPPEKWPEMERFLGALAWARRMSQARGAQVDVTDFLEAWRDCHYGQGGDVV